MTTSTLTAKQLVYSRFVSSDLGLQRLSFHSCLRQLKRLLSWIVQRSQVLSQIHFIWMLLQHFARQDLTISLFVVVDMVLVQRTHLLHLYLQYTKSWRRMHQKPDSQSVLLMMLQIFLFQRLSQLLLLQLLVQRSASSGVLVEMVL